MIKKKNSDKVKINHKTKGEREKGKGERQLNTKEVPFKDLNFPT